MALIPAQIMRVISTWRAPHPLAAALAARVNGLSVSDVNGTRGTVRIGEPASLGGVKFSGYASGGQSFRGAGSIVPAGAIRAGMGSGLPGTQAPFGESSPLLDAIGRAQGTPTAVRKK